MSYILADIAICLCILFCCFRVDCR